MEIVTGSERGGKDVFPIKFAVNQHYAGNHVCVCTKIEPHTASSLNLVRVYPKSWKLF